MPFGIIGDRLDREISLPESLLVALALSLLLVFWLYPMQFLIGNSAFFDNGDASQHVSGWLMFK
jgi:hypothetical protein